MSGQKRSISKELCSGDLVEARSLIASVAGSAGSADSIETVAKAALERRVMGIFAGDALRMLVPFAVEPGGAAQLGTPLFHSSDTPRAGEFLHEAAKGIFRLEATSVTAAVEPGHWSCRTLADAGFAMATRMLQLTLGTPAETDAAPGDWVTYDAGRRGEFANVFYDTLEGSLDCPEVPVCRDSERLMQSFEARGTHEDADFALLFDEGAPAGILLLVLGHETLEILYLGVVPDMRGKGLGLLLASRAVERARAHGAPSITVTVDSRNTPAKDVYARLGFSESRAVCLYYLVKKEF